VLLAQDFSQVEFVRKSAEIAPCGRGSAVKGGDVAETLLKIAIPMLSVQPRVKTKKGLASSEGRMRVIMELLASSCAQRF
jgi:hypothetical protein